MWIILPELGFFSITLAYYNVEDDLCGQMLQVRARRRADLERLIERFELVGDMATIIESADSDYRYRIIVHRTVVGAMLCQAALECETENVKAAAVKAGMVPDFNQAMHETWAVWKRYQDAEPKSKGAPS